MSAAAHRWTACGSRLVAATLGLIAATSSLQAQTATRLNARPAQVTPRIELKITQADLMALRAAKARPSAVLLRTAIARLPRDRVDLALVDRSQVPVLVSPRPLLVANLHVFAERDHYTASASQNGLAVEINGTRLARPVPSNFRLPPVMRKVPLKPQMAPQPLPRILAPRPAQTAAPADVLSNVNVEHTSYGIDVSFTRFGAVYNVTMDCGASADDPEAIGPAPGAAPPAEGCSEAGALALVSELEVAGGGEAPP